MRRLEEAFAGGAGDVAVDEQVFDRLGRLCCGEVLREGSGVLVRPRSADGAARVVAFAAERGIAVAAAAVGGVRLDRSCLSLVGLPDRRAMWIRCGAGAPVQQVEAALQRVGLTLGSQPPSLFRGTVADWLEGPFAGRRAMDGRLESGVAAVEAVLPDGSRYAGLPAPRSAAGPAVSHLLLGGGGACGWMLGATLKARRQPGRFRTVTIFGAPPLLARLLQRAVQSHLPPWEVRCLAPDRMELRWSADREDEAAAVATFRRQAREANAAVAQVQEWAPFESGAEREVPTGALPALLEGMGPGERLRLVRLAGESCVAVGALPPDLPGVCRPHPLHARIAAALRP